MKRPLSNTYFATPEDEQGKGERFGQETAVHREEGRRDVRFVGGTSFS